MSDSSPSSHSASEAVNGSSPSIHSAIEAVNGSSPSTHSAGEEDNGLVPSVMELQRFVVLPLNEPQPQPQPMQLPIPERQYGNDDDGIMITYLISLPQLSNQSEFVVGSTSTAHHLQGNDELVFRCVIISTTVIHSRGQYFHITHEVMISMIESVPMFND